MYQRKWGEIKKKKKKSTVLKSVTDNAGDEEMVRLVLLPNTYCIYLLLP